MVLLTTDGLPNLFQEDRFPETVNQIRARLSKADDVREAEEQIEKELGGLSRKYDGDDVSIAVLKRVNPGDGFNKADAVALTREALAESSSAVAGVRAALTKVTEDQAGIIAELRSVRAQLSPQSPPKEPPKALTWLTLVFSVVGCGLVTFLLARGLQDQPQTKTVVQSAPSPPRRSAPTQPDPSSADHQVVLPTELKGAVVDPADGSAPLAASGLDVLADGPGFHLQGRYNASLYYVALQATHILVGSVDYGLRQTGPEPVRLSLNPVEFDPSHPSLHLEATEGQPIVKIFKIEFKRIDMPTDPS